MKRNLHGVRKEMFLMYPRFIQMILNARYLDKNVNTLELKPMGLGCFGAGKQVRQTTKVKFMGRYPLVKCGNSPLLKKTLMNQSHR
ncbi:hypothetical protein Hanom_Chr04g00333201 [Helianthus anomalus]